MKRRTPDMPLTDRQEQLLNLLIADPHRTVRELQALTGISSTSVVNYNLMALQRAGRLVRGPRGQARRWRVVGQSEGRSASLVVERAKAWRHRDPELDRLIAEYEA